MTTRGTVALVGATAGLVVLCVIAPFLPGAYDPLAVPLSMTVQVVGAAGLVLVPFVWWRRGLPVVGSIVVAAVALGVGYAVSVALGALLLLGWAAAVTRWRAAVPVLLVVVPVTTLLCQLVLAGPLTAATRDRAITAAAELIGEIERHHDTHGSYPSSLNAVWPDWSPSVAGIDRYRYGSAGGAYNLSFEQPRLLFDNFGTREFVVYNPLDEHLVPSHASWILIWSTPQLTAQQGWYAAHDTATPHWRYFWFD